MSPLDIFGEGRDKYAGEAICKPQAWSVSSVLVSEALGKTPINALSNNFSWHIKSHEFCTLLFSPTAVPIIFLTEEGYKKYKIHTLDYGRAVWEHLLN